MNGKKARALRREAPNRKLYRAMKRAEQRDGQNPKFAAVRKRKPKRPIKATWPSTPDQMTQGRPVIYARPVHALFAGIKSERIKDELRSSCNAMPKWLIDQAAARGFL